FDGTVADVLDLPKPVFEDKMWLVKRMFDESQLTELALQISAGLKDEPLTQYFRQIEDLLGEPQSEGNRREIADRLTSIYNRVIALNNIAAGNVHPAEYLKRTRDKQEEIIKIARRISED